MLNNLLFHVTGNSTKTLWCTERERERERERECHTFINLYILMRTSPTSKLITACAYISSMYYSHLSSAQVLYPSSRSWGVEREQSQRLSGWAGDRGRGWGRMSGKCL